MAWLPRASSTMRALVLAACATAQQQLFAPAPALDVSSQAMYGAAPVFAQEPLPAFQAPPAFLSAQPPAESQHSAAAFIAGAMVVAAVCTRGRAPAMAAVDGQEVLSRRAMLAGLAATAPLFAAISPAHAAKAIWDKRTPPSGAKPLSVKKGCNVEKPCSKGAAFPLSDRSNKVAEKKFNKALDKFKARQPKQPKEES